MLEYLTNHEERVKNILKLYFFVPFYKVFDFCGLFF